MVKLSGPPAGRLVHLAEEIALQLRAVPIGEILWSGGTSEGRAESKGARVCGWSAWQRWRLLQQQYHDSIIVRTVDQALQAEQMRDAYIEFRQLQFCLWLAERCQGPGREATHSTLF